MKKLGREDCPWEARSSIIGEDAFIPRAGAAMNRRSMKDAIGGVGGGEE